MTADVALPVAWVGPERAGDVAVLLDRFNREFATPTPGPDVLAERLQRLLGGTRTRAILVDDGEPVAVALVTTRPNVWFDGPVALLDELYVVPERRSAGIGGRVIDLMTRDLFAEGIDLIEINVDEPDLDAQRFYRRNGFSEIDPDGGTRALTFWRERR